jgi:CRISPR-associated endonuclease/helicase Cas3
MPDFEAFFQAATGCRPYGYQARIARAGLPALLRVPDGGGRTAVILAWLWRRLHGPDQAGTPRRLMYVLPPGSLTEPVSARLLTWLANLDLADEVAVHVVRGGRNESTGDWRENPHQPAIVVGHAGLLVSKALNRAYGTGRAGYPIDFALAGNGAQWIVDELALCPAATATLRQLAGLAAALGTAEPFGLTCCTAVGGARPPASTGPAAGPVVEIKPRERTGELAVRLSGTRTIRRAPLSPGDYRALAAFAGTVHRPGTLTLVALNRVPAAQQVYRRLRDGPARCALLHSQLRGTERAALLADIAARPADLIVVSAGEAASALDLSAATVLTEAAPWPSLVRRAGRANRSGRVPDAALWWLPPPADQAIVSAACAELTRLEGVPVTTQDLQACRVQAVPATTAGATPLGREELAALFDTWPVPAAGVDGYLRDAGEPELELELAWATWAAGPDGAPDPEVRYPAPEYRCRVPASVAMSPQAAPSGASTGPGGSGSGSPASRRPNRTNCCSSTPPTAATTSRPAVTRRRGHRYRTAPRCWPPRSSPSARPPPPRPPRYPGRPASHGNGSRSPATASRSATRPPRCSPSSLRPCRQPPRGPPCWPATCTTRERRTRSGRTPSARWRPRPTRRWSRRAARGPSRAPPAALSSPAAFTSGTSSRRCC